MQVILQVVPKQVGELRILGLAYILEGGESGSAGVGGRQLLLPRGRRLPSAKDSETEDTALYAADHRLKFNVQEFAPSLRVMRTGHTKQTYENIYNLHNYPQEILCFLGLLVLSTNFSPFAR